MYAIRSYYGADFHGAGGTGRHAQFADTTFLLVKSHEHLRTPDMERACGTDGSAGSALDTPVFIAPDFLIRILDLYALGFQKFHTVLEIPAFAVKFQNQNPFFPGKYFSIQYIESQVIIPDQITDSYNFV